MKKPAKLLHKISHKRIDPPPLTGDTPLPRLVDEAFLSYNAGRLREACQLFTTKMLADDATVGLSLSGALTPAGLGISCLVPLVEAGLHRLDRQHRGQPLSRHAFRPRHGHAPVAARPRRPRPAQAPGHPHLRHRFRLRKPARHRPLLSHALPRRGVSEDVRHRGVPLPGRQVPGGRDGGRARPTAIAACWRRPIAGGVPIFTRRRATAPSA